MRKLWLLKIFAYICRNINDKPFNYINMKKNLLILLMVSMAFVMSCSEDRHSVPSNSMVFQDNVEYVDDFPVTLTLDEGEKLEKPYSATSMCILDSIILMANGRGDEGCIRGFTYPGMEFIGQFGLIGRGPGEFDANSGFTFRTVVTNENGVNYYIREDGKGSVLKINIDNSLKNSVTDYVVVQDSIPPVVPGYLYIDDSTYMLGNFAGYDIERFVYRNGVNINSDVVETLNESAVMHSNDGYNFNILSVQRRYNKDLGLVIEAPIMLNAINIYSLDGTVAKSICIDEDVDDVDEVQNLDIAYYPTTFTDIRLYPDFFAVAYLGDTEMSIQTTRDKLPQLMLFDYEGKPIADIKIPYHITNFEFDVKNGLLYIGEEDDFICYRYDVSDII